MVQTSDILSLSGSARDRWVEGRIQDHLGLLKGILLTEVLQELKEPDVTRRVALAEATEHTQVGLEQGEQALRAILVHFTTCVLFLGVIHERMHVPLHRPLAAGRVGREPTPRLDCQICCLLDRLHGASSRRLDDDRPLATDPGTNRGPVFVIMAPARLTLLAAPTRSATQRLCAALLALALLAARWKWPLGAWPWSS
jgi:hypothetical protein